MDINIKDYIKNGEFIEKLEGYSEISAEELGFLSGSDVEFVGNIGVKSLISLKNGLISSDFDIFVNFKFICSRCLNSFDYDLDLKLSDEFFLNELDEDILIDEDGNLNFKEYIKNNIVINIPQKKVCNNVCLGLCQFCGINLNNNRCKCGEIESQNAFSNLSVLFENLKEV